MPVCTAKQTDKMVFVGLSPTYLSLRDQCAHWFAMTAFISQTPIYRSAWGKDPAEAVHNAVVLEEVAKMAALTELIGGRPGPAPQHIQDKHFYRKHGANAYYGQ